MPMPENTPANLDRTYIVVGRSRASAIFKEDETLTVTYQYQGLQPAEITFRTRFHEKGFEVRVPGDLWVEARGRATNLDSAATIFGNGPEIL